MQTINLEKAQVITTIKLDKTKSKYGDATCCKVAMKNDGRQVSTNLSHLSNKVRQKWLDLSMGDLTGKMPATPYSELKAVKLGN